MFRIIYNNLYTNKRYHLVVSSRGGYCTLHSAQQSTTRLLLLLGFSLLSTIRYRVVYNEEEEQDAH